jgi:hypothetical protein
MKGPAFKPEIFMSLNDYPYMQKTLSSVLMHLLLLTKILIR